MIKPPKPTRQETALSVIIVLCIVGFVGVVFAGLFIKQAGNDSLFGFLGFVFFAGLCLSNWMHKKCAQRSRDNYALYLLNATKAGEVSEFAVFLRPFYTTGKVKEKVVHMNFAGSSTPTTVTHNLEETLIDALAMPVVALGEPGETYGAGRILENEDSWKGTVSELMPRASILICIPSGHPGTRWELDEIIKNHYLEKTVFLMPRDSTPLWFKWKAMRDDWDAAAAHMERHGLRIPPFRRVGLLFVIRPTVGCFIEALSLTSSEELGRAITRLSSSIPSSARFEVNTAAHFH